MRDDYGAPSWLVHALAGCQLPTQRGRHAKWTCPDCGRKFRTERAEALVAVDPACRVDIGGWEWEVAS